MLGLYHLNALFKIQKEMFFIHNKEDLCRFVLDECRTTLNSQAGTLFLIDHAESLMIPIVAVGASIEQLKRVPGKIGIGICGWVAEHVQGIIVEQPETDPRFFQGVDIITGMKTKNIICSPIHLRGKLIGIIELLNRTDSNFKTIDLEFLNLIAQQTAVALETTRLYEEVSSLAAFKESIIESLTGGFIALAKKGAVTEFNNAARLILHLNPNEALKKNYLEAFIRIQPLQKIFTQLVQDLTPRKRLEFEWVIDGEKKRIGYSTFLIVNRESAVIGYGMTFQDLTNLKK